MITTLETPKPKDCTWDDVNIRLFNEKLMQKRKGDSSQTFETTLLVQKHIECNKNMKDRSKDYNYCKLIGHWDRNYTLEEKNLMHQRIKDRRKKHC